MSDDEFVEASIKQQRKLFDCQARIREQRALLDECERALEIVLDYHPQSSYPHARATLAKLRAHPEKD